MHLPWEPPQGAAPPQCPPARGTPVTTATARPAPLPHWPGRLSITRYRAGRGGQGRRGPAPCRCGGSAHLDVEVGGVEAPRRDEPGLGRPQVPRHQLAGPLHQELAVPLRRHLAAGQRRACALLPAAPPRPAPPAGGGVRARRHLGRALSGAGRWAVAGGACCCASGGSRDSLCSQSLIGINSDFRGSLFICQEPVW